MAMPPQKTGDQQPSGNPNQPAFAVGQAASGNQTLANRSVSVAEMMRATNPSPTGNPMSHPTANSNPNLAAQVAAQAAQAAIPAAKAQARNAESDTHDELSPAETDEQLAKAWGFSGSCNDPATWPFSRNGECNRA